MGAPAEGTPVQTKPARSRGKPLIVLALVVLAAGTFIGVARVTGHQDPTAAQITHWKSVAEEAQQRSQEYQSQLQDLKAEITAAVGNLEHPHFTTWNGCGAGHDGGCPLKPGFRYVSGIPDTFTFHVGFRSTVPVTAWIMTTHDYACWATRSCAWRYIGPTKPTTHLKEADFHLAEGCAGYVFVLFSDRVGTIYPEVAITRNPAAHATGACR